MANLADRLEEYYWKLYGHDGTDSFDRDSVMDVIESAFNKSAGSAGTTIAKLVNSGRAIKLPESTSHHAVYRLTRVQEHMDKGKAVVTEDAVPVGGTAPVAEVLKRFKDSESLDLSGVPDDVLSASVALEIVNEEPSNPDDTLKVIHFAGDGVLRVRTLRDDIRSKIYELFDSGDLTTARKKQMVNEIRRRQTNYANSIAILQDATRRGKHDPVATFDGIMQVLRTLAETVKDNTTDTEGFRDALIQVTESMALNLDELLGRLVTVMEAQATGTDTLMENMLVLETRHNELAARTVAPTKPALSVDEQTDEYIKGYRLGYDDGLNKGKEMFDGNE
jgi:hypothetical protein